MSIYLSFFLYKEACRFPPPLAACLSVVGMFTNNDSLSCLFRALFSVLDIKLLMIAAYLTLGEVIWLLFELVLKVLRTRTDKTAVTYIEVAFINLHFKCRLI